MWLLDDIKSFYDDRVIDPHIDKIRRANRYKECHIVPQLERLSFGHPLISLNGRLVAGSVLSVQSTFSRLYSTNSIHWCSLDTAGNGNTHDEAIASLDQHATERYDKTLKICIIGDVGYIKEGRFMPILNCLRANHEEIRMSPFPSESHLYEEPLDACQDIHPASRSYLVLSNRDKSHLLVSEPAHDVAQFKEELTRQASVLTSTLKFVSYILT